MGIAKHQKENLLINANIYFTFLTSYMRCEMKLYALKVNATEIYVIPNT